MYDTLGMFLEKNYIRIDSLDNLREIYNKETGEIIMEGTLGNLRVKSSGNKTSVIGSIPKFYLGNNFQQLTRTDIENSIEKLSDILKIPLNESKVYRLDIGANFILNEPLQNYYSCLGNLSRFKKSTIANKNSLIYSTYAKSLEFYNKLTEMRRNRQTIPKLLIGQNVLRYEIHLKKRIAKSLRLTEIRTKDLFEENFYIKVINFWKDQYFSIQRVNTLKVNKELLPVLNRRTLINALAALQVKDIGVHELFTLIEVNKNNFKHREQFQRMKNLIRDLSTYPELTEPSEAIKELDEKIIRKVEKEII